MDKETFWATKNHLPQYQAIVFEHPAFDAPIRLVADQFESLILGGHVHQPAPMTIKPPDQSGDATAKLALAFPRAVVGREFKRQLKRVRDSGSRSPIEVRYVVYLDDLTTPEISWLLYIAEQGGVTFDAEAVRVSATVDNPMRKSSGLIYDPATFTGLEIL